MLFVFILRFYFVLLIVSPRRVELSVCILFVFSPTILSRVNVPDIQDTVLLDPDFGVSFQPVVVRVRMYLYICNMRGYTCLPIGTAIGLLSNFNVKGMLNALGP